MEGLSGFGMGAMEHATGILLATAAIAIVGWVWTAIRKQRENKLRIAAFETTCGFR
jgi:hypothetical protein